MSVLGMDVGSHTIKLVESTGGKRPQILRAFLLDTPQNAVSDGEIREMDALVSVLQQFVQKNRIRAKELHIALQSSQVASREIRLPALKRDEVTPAVEFDLSQSFPGIMQSHTLSCSLYNKPGEPVVGISAFCPTRILEGYVELSRRLDMTLIRIDASFNATQRCFLQNSLSKIDEESVLLVDIGMSITQVSILSKGRIVLSRSVGAGAQQVDELMASRFGLSLEESRQIRTNAKYGDYIQNDDDLTSFIRLGFSSVEDLVRQTLDYHRFNKEQDTPVKRIFLTGGGSIFKGLDVYLTDVFRLPAEAVRINLKSFPGALRPELFLSAVGVALETKSITEDINLIPNIRAITTAQHRGGKRTLVYALGGIVILATLASYAVVLWLVNGEADRTEALRLRTEEYASVNEVKQQLAGVEKLKLGMENVLAGAASATLVHTAMLDTVSQNMPLGVFVQNYVVTGRSSLALSGIAQTRGDIAVLINRIKQLDFMNDVQVQNVTTRLGEDGSPIDYNFTLTATMKQ